MSLHCLDRKGQWVIEGDAAKPWGGGRLREGGALISMRGVLYAVRGVGGGLLGVGMTCETKNEPSLSQSRGSFSVSTDQISVDPVLLSPLIKALTQRWQNKEPWPLASTHLDAHNAKRRPRQHPDQYSDRKNTSTHNLHTHSHTHT